MEQGKLIELKRKLHDFEVELKTYANNAFVEIGNLLYEFAEDPDTINKVLYKISIFKIIGVITDLQYDYIEDYLMTAYYNYPENDTTEINKILKCKSNQQKLVFVQNLLFDIDDYIYNNQLNE